MKHKVQSLFQINFQPNWFGSLSTDGVIHFKFNKKTHVFREFESQLHSSSTLFYNSGSIYTNDQNSLSINVHSIQFNDYFNKIVTKTHPVVFTSSGNIVTIVSRIHMNFSVEEIGHLNFGLELCKAINKFYDAITYIPPHGNQLLRKTNLGECISMTQSLVDILIISI